ncbi:MAG: hypothetical protein JST17_13010 [Bacteroidetes bacterium]|nr:hypothetical protein [Bacteroidota bacterium]MBS1931064.1 hypothetical protein [Bacteroidota bacterium]
MEFKPEELIKRELEIALELLKNHSFSQIAGHIGISKKILKAHIRNMMQKLQTENLEGLKKMIKVKLEEDEGIFKVITAAREQKNHSFRNQ